jgi:LPXTG-motif cell wall-anchored protein
VAGAIVPDTETAATPDTGAVYSGGGDVIEQALTLTASGQDAAWRAHARGVLPPGMELSTAGGATAGGSQTDAAKAGGTHTGATMAEATTVDGTKTDAFEGGSTSAAASAAGPAAVEPPAGASAEVREPESRNGVNASIVPRPSFNPGRLAHTGFEAGWLVLLGAGLALLGGFFAVLAVRRRRTDEAEEADSP